MVALFVHQIFCTWCQVKARMASQVQKIDKKRSITKISIIAANIIKEADIRITRLHQQPIKK